MSLVADPIRITFEDVARLGRGANGFANRIYLHWTGGHYGHVYEDYHISIDWDAVLCLARRKRHCIILLGLKS